MLLFCHVTSWDHMIKETWDFARENPLTLYSTVSTLLTIDPYRSFGSGDISFLFCHMSFRKQKYKYLSEWKPLNLSHHSFKIDGCRPGDVKIYVDFLIWPKKEILFKKFSHPFHWPKIIFFKNSKKIRLTYFKILVVINV